VCGERALFVFCLSQTGFVKVKLVKVKLVVKTIMMRKQLAKTPVAVNEKYLAVVKQSVTIGSMMKGRVDVLLLVYVVDMNTARNTFAKRLK
jgi:hypothetical protein